MATHAALIEPSITVHWHRVPDRPANRQMQHAEPWGSRTSKEGLKATYKSALERFDRELRMRLLFHRAVQLLDKYGDFFLNHTDDEVALNAFMETQKQATHLVRCLNHLAVYAWEKGDIQNAVNYLSRAMALDPDDRETVWNCGQVMHFAGERLLAKHTYLRYMKHHGHDQEMAEALAVLSG
ncbi:MAG: hypothetical protein QNJ97_24555 [Myxococcota bacterium]|nr:hypothetical protein [Myxococcota bacterium]